MGLFGGKGGGAGSRSDSARVSRHSSGWTQMEKHLKSEDSLRVLDIGPTSAGNINLITQMGHSVYMANLVEDAVKPEYVSTSNEGETVHEVQRYLTQNLDFAGRHFDVVLLWDTADYLPEPMLQPIIDRIFDVMEPGGKLLAFFHSKATGDDTIFSRYHLTSTDQVEMQRTGVHPVLRTYTNRQIEGVFERFSGYKFLLAKDSLREVIVTR